MTQIEFEKLIRDLHQEKINTKTKLNAELAEIEARRAEARKVLDESNAHYKDVCRELSGKQREMQDVNNLYHQRKQALLQAFQEAIGTQAEENNRKRHECFAIRARMIASLKEQLKDEPGINVDEIDVHFHIEDEDITFTTVIPKCSVGF